MAAEQYGGEVYRFSGCEVRLDEQLVRVAGKEIALRSRGFAVLRTLIRRPGEIVSRNELIDAVWPGLVVEENNLSVQIGYVRKALGPAADAIKTFPGIGYRFSAPLEGVAEPLASSPAPAAEPVAVRLGNISRCQPALIGRQAASIEVAQLIGQHRLVTLCGAGGMGKTRLAIAVAANMRDDFRDGAWIVELASVSDPQWLQGMETAARVDAQLAAIVAAVAQTLELKLPARGEPDTQLALALDGRRMLLLLDNCEHLIDAAARLAGAVLKHAPDVRLLVTSQQPLNLAQEQRCPVDPLSIPAPHDPAFASHGAIELLVARVRALDPRFVLDATNSAQAVELCRRLDGMPLAIELAAARVPFLGVAQVCNLLDQSLRLLVGGSRFGPARHRTMEETLAWSHSLLSPHEQAVFRRCGVFSGSFALRQAEKVLAGEGTDAWQAIEHLATLVGRSLVVLDRSDPPRYRLLESARAYALQAMQDAEDAQATRARHANAMCELFEESLDAEWTMPSQDRIEQYMPDLDNGRAALEWTRGHDAALHIRLVGALGWLFDAATQNVEGLDHCLRAQAMDVQATLPARTRARLQIALAIVGRTSQKKLAMAAARNAVRLLRTTDDARALYAAWGRFAILAALCIRGRRGQLAVRHMQRLRRDDWPRRSEWDLLNADDYVSNCVGDKARAERLAQEQADWAAEHGDIHKMMFGILASEQCAATRGHYEKSVELGEKLMALAGQHRHVNNRHVYIHNLACALAMCGRADPALHWASQSIREYRRLDALDETLELVAKLALLRGRTDAAALIVGCSEAANAWRQNQREPAERNLYEDVVAHLEQSLTRGALDLLRSLGLWLSHERAVDLALGNDDEHEAVLARVRAGLERKAQARVLDGEKAAREWRTAGTTAADDAT